MSQTALECILRTIAYKSVSDKKKITKVCCSGVKAFCQSQSQNLPYLIALGFKCMALSKLSIISYHGLLGLLKNIWNQRY